MVVTQGEPPGARNIQHTADAQDSEVQHADSAQTGGYQAALGGNAFASVRHVMQMDAHDAALAGHHLSWSDVSLVSVHGHTDEEEEL